MSILDKVTINKSESVTCKLSIMIALYDTLKKSATFGYKVLTNKPGHVCIHQI